MNDNSLNLFFGRPPSEDFLEDLGILKKIPEKEVFEIMNWTIKYYPTGNIDDEWKKLSKNLKNKEKKEKIIRIFLFIFKQFAVGHINEDELKEDFKSLGLSQKYLDYFIKKLSENNEFRKRVLRQEQPYRNLLSSVDWRIDRQNYGQDFGENVCILEFTYLSKGEKQIAQFELKLEGVKDLIFILNIIEKKLNRLK